MSNTELSNLFLLYINNNYRTIQSSFKKASQFKYKLSEDLYHDGILKAAESISKNGFRFIAELSGKSFENYLFISLRNIVQNDSIKNARLPIDENFNMNHEDDTDMDGCKTLESLSYDMEQSHEEEYNRISEDCIIEEIFQYVESRYPAMSTGFFKFYFKTEYSLKDISKMTGFGITTVFTHISKIKKDVRDNFKHRQLPHRILNKLNKDI